MITYGDELTVKIQKVQAKAERVPRPAVPVIRLLRPEGFWDFETSLGYMISCKFSMHYYVRCCLKQNKTKQANKPN